jgi:hypothetical protein
MFAVWDGDVFPEDVHAHLLRLAADPDWPTGRLQLTDLTTLHRVEVPDADLVSLLYEGTTLLDDLRFALVLRPSVITAFAPALAPRAKEIPMLGTFSHLAAASEYLGIPRAVAQEVCDALRNEVRATSGVPAAHAVGNENGPR